MACNKYVRCFEVWWQNLVEGPWKNLSDKEKTYSWVFFMVIYRSFMCFFSDVPFIFLVDYISKMNSSLIDWFRIFSFFSVGGRGETLFKTDNTVNLFSSCLKCVNIRDYWLFRVCVNFKMITCTYRVGAVQN